MKKIIKGINWFLELGGLKKEIALLVISAAFLLISIFDLIPLPFDAAWIAIVLCGLPIILEAIVGLINSFDIKADLLVSIALIASVIIGEYFAAGEVAFIMQLGALLEDLTVSRARAGIEKLVKLSPKTARVIEGESEQIIPALDVRAGDIVRVLPGESVPADGVILSGTTSVNQAVMTGESLPVDKGPGDEVLSGTLNQYGAIDFRAEKAGADSSIQRMIKLVQSADAGKAKIVGLADRWATWIVVIALAAALLTFAVTGEILRAVTILVVFCPCALVLATPTAIMAAIGNAAKHGFLVQDGGALERLSKVQRVAFDKTGTLTYGTPEVKKVVATAPGFDENQVLALAAAAEKLSEHPLAKAVVKSCKGLAAAPSGFQMLPGRGVSALVDGKRVLAGNAKLIRDNGTDIPKNAYDTAQKLTATGATIIYVACDNTLCGLIALSDTLRKESAAMIDDIKACGLEPVLLTGDHAGAAAAVSKALGISSTQPGCLPEHKLEFIKRSQQQSKSILMIGDGVNDAPALKRADVGIAMGKTGSDIAVDAADITLVDDNIKELGHIIRLSKRMMLTIKINLTFSMALNFIAIILAMTGVLNPVVGALVHNAGSVLVIINSALLLKFKK